MALTVTKCLEFGFAMDGRVCTPKRVKDILSSFLHYVIPEDVSQQSSSEEALSHTGGGETVDRAAPSTRSASATDRTAFFLRVHTYSPLTWFAKPAWFSALVCARYGWVNVDVDVLQCVGCGNHLSGRMLQSFEPQVYAECCKKLVGSLRTAHSAFCCWVSNPSPESFLRLPLSSRVMAEMEFVNLLKSLLRLQSELPRIDSVLLESMGLTREILLSLRHYAGIADQSCDDGSHDPDDMFCSACMLAVCGWASSSSVGVSQLRCRYCNRTVGLWNNHTYASPGPPSVCDESHDNGNVSSPGGDTCGTPSKSHDSSSGSPAGGTASNPTPESERSVEDADEHSTRSDSEKDRSGKGVSSPTGGARDEGGEGGVVGGNGQSESDSRSRSSLNGSDDSKSESSSDSESEKENGVTEEDSVQQGGSDVLPEGSEEGVEQTESGNDKNIEQTENDKGENGEELETDQEENIEQTESDKGENLEKNETDKGENGEQIENDKDEHTDITESDNEEHVVEQTKNESNNSQQSDTASEVDTVDGCCLQEVKCFEKSAEVDAITPCHQPQTDLTHLEDVKTNNLKTENHEEHSGDAGESGDGGKATMGEADEPMEGDALGEDKDETSQRTSVDDSVGRSATGQQSLDNGQNGVTSHTEAEVEPSAKRRRLMPARVTFDPVAEHHTWCPWVLPDVATDRSDDALTAGDEHRQPGWRRFLDMLTPADSRQSHSLISIVKTSPPCVGLRSIRKLFHGWTRTATPDS